MNYVITPRRIAAVALLVVLASVGSAQTTAQSGSQAAIQVSAPSIEDVFLGTAVSVESLAAQIRTGGRDIRLLALRSLEDQLLRGDLDPDDERLYIALEPAVDEGVFRINHSVHRSMFIYDPMVRREAVKVMGMLGTDRAQEKLVAIALNDPEPLVRAQALRGIASIARDPDGEVSKAVARVILRERAGNPHQESVLEAVIALEAIAQGSRNKLHPSAREMVVHVASDFIYIQIVRARAVIALTSM